MAITQRISPCLWFADQAEEAARFNVGYWERLGEGGDPAAQRCGWLEDRYGLSWQVVPAGMDALFADETSEATRRTMEAMLQMTKLDVAALRRAHDGTAS